MSTCNLGIYKKTNSLLALFKDYVHMSPTAILQKASQKGYCFEYMNFYYGLLFFENYLLIPYPNLYGKCCLAWWKMFVEDPIFLSIMQVAFSWKQCCKFPSTFFFFFAQIFKRQIRQLLARCFYSLYKVCIISISCFAGWIYPTVLIKIYSYLAKCLQKQSFRENILHWFFTFP